MPQLAVRSPAKLPSASRTESASSRVTTAQKHPSGRDSGLGARSRVDKHKTSQDQ